MAWLLHLKFMYKTGENTFPDVQFSEIVVQAVRFQFCSCVHWDNFGEDFGKIFAASKSFSEDFKLY